MIKVTDRAKEKILEIRKEEGHSNHFLRIDVCGGGCSGLSYDLKFDDKIDDNNDRVFELCDNLNIVTDIKSLLYLMGSELDYSDGLNGKGFVFDNPHAKRTCGCGISFSV